MWLNALCSTGGCFLLEVRSPVNPPSRDTEFARLSMVSVYKNGAEDGIRTHDPLLGKKGQGFCSWKGGV